MAVKMKFVIPTKAHQALRDDMYDAMRRHADEMTTAEVIGVTSQLIGHVIAVTSQPGMLEELLEVVRKNVESGRETALLQIAETQGNA